MKLSLTSCLAAAVIGSSINAEPAAEAQSILCAGREGVITRLHAKYGEGRIFEGLASTQRHVIEIHTNEDTDTWTVTTTDTNGMTCLMAAGTGYSTDVVKTLTLPTNYTKKIANSVLAGEKNERLKNHFQTPPKKDEHIIKITGLEPKA